MRRAVSDCNRVMMPDLRGGLEGGCFASSSVGGGMLRRGHHNSAVTGERSKEKSSLGRGAAHAKASLACPRPCRGQCKCDL